MAYHPPSVPSPESALTSLVRIDYNASSAASRYDMNWGGDGYAEYQGFMKVSGQEKAAQAQTAQEAQLMMSWMQIQFQEQQKSPETAC